MPLISGLPVAGADVSSADLITVERIGQNKLEKLTLLELFTEHALGGVVTIDDGNNRVGVNISPLHPLHVYTASGDLTAMLQSAGTNSRSQWYYQNDSQTYLAGVVGGAGDNFRIDDVNAATSPFQIETGCPTNAAYLESQGNLIIGGVVSPASGVSCLVINNGTEPSAGVANAAGLFAKDVSSSSELFGFDEAGNKPQLTPHGYVLFEQPHEAAWSYYCTNSQTGWEVNADMWSLFGMVEALWEKTMGEKRQILFTRNLFGE